MCSRAMIKMDVDTTSKPRLTTVAAQHIHTIESSERSLSVPPLKQDSKVLSDRILCRPGLLISIANTSPETSPYDLLYKLFT
nr:hypothetical protein [Tanacetum cinerariifolium]